MEIRFTPSHVTITEKLDRELRIHLSSGKCIVLTGDNQTLSEVDRYARAEIGTESGWIGLDHKAFTSTNLIDSQNFNDDDWKKSI